MTEILRNLRKNNKAGFTLAELLIVIAITGILAAFGFGQVAAYQKKLKRTEMDNVAREIFVAAQNHLTASKAAGTWNTAFYNESTSSSLITSTDWQKPITYTISDYPTEEESGTVQTAAVHKYYYVVYNSTTYKDALTSSKSVLSQLLPYGSIDETIRSGGSYIIEFDASTQTIYGVFYTEGTAGGYLGSDNSRSYFTSDAETLGLNKVRGDDEASARADFTLGGKQVAVGYYGGATAVKNESTQLSQPEITINNGRVLEVVVLDKNKTSKNNTISITVTPTSVTSTDVAKAQQATINIDPNSTSPITGTNINPANFAQNTVWWTVDTSAGREYHIVFDNIFGTNTHFVNLFKLIAPGSNIQVSAAVSYKGNKSGTSGAKDTNSIFGNASLENTTSTVEYSASIENGRHLANLSKDVSGYAKTSELNITSASLSLNMINESTNIFNWGSFAGSDSVTKTDGNSVSGSRFLSIDNLTLKTFKGNNLILKNFNVLSDGQAAGLFSVGYGLNVSDLDLVDFKVYASQSCGTLMGKANEGTSITNVHVYNSSTDLYGTSDGQYWVNSSKNYAGGLVGEINGSTSINNSSASVKVGKYTSSNATKASGGLIGAVTAGSVDIEESYVGGKVQDKYSYNIQSISDANISGATAGGLIGSITSAGSANITDSYTTASAFGTGVSGGFVGNVDGYLTISNVYAAGSVGGNGYEGSFIGYLNYDNLTVETDSKYVAILDKVSNVNDIYEFGNYSTQSIVSILDEESLKSFKLSSITAVPYSALTTVYPYPGTTSGIHHGDWAEVKGASVTFKKNVHFVGTVDETTELNYIRQNTEFELYRLTDYNPVSTYTRYYYNYFGNPYDYSYEYVGTYSLNGASLVNNNGTYSFEQTIEDLQPGYFYFFVEKTSGTGYQNLTNHYKQLSANNYFNTTWTGKLSVKYYSYFYQFTWTYTYSGSGVTTYALPIYNTNQTTTFAYDNYYQPKASDSGLLYYEKYADGTYKLSGYSSDDDKIGDSNFATAEGTKIVDEGYVLAIKNIYFANGKSGPEQINVDIGYYTGSSSIYEDKYETLAKRMKDGVLSEVSSSDVTAMGLTGNKVYKLNLGLTYRKSVRLDGEALVTVKDGNNQNANFIGTYTMNPYFADSVQPNSTLNGDTYHKLRTSSQLNRIIEKQGVNILNGWISGTVEVHQQLDIDMSSYYSTQLSAGTTNYFITKLEKATSYIGDSVTLTDGTVRKPILSGIGNTFIQYTDTNSSMKNMTVQLNVSGLSTAQIRSAAYGESYGMFIDQVNGTLTDITFDTSTVKGLTIPSKTGTTNYQAVGIIGYAYSNLNNITFNNTVYEGVSANCSGFGLIGSIGLDSSNITISGTKWTGNTISASAVGLLGYTYSDMNNITITNTDFENNTINATYFGCIGCFTKAKLTNVIIDGTIWNGGSINKYSTVVGGVGLIGYVNGSATVSNINLLNTTWSNITINGSNVGLIGMLDDGATYLSGLTVNHVKWINVSGTANDYGIIGYAGNTSIRSYGNINSSINDVSWNTVQLNSDCVGLLGRYKGQSNGLSISQVIWNGVTVTPLTTNWKNLQTYDSMSSFALIPEIEKAFTNTTISHVEIVNSTAKSSSAGIIGYINSSVTTLNVSDVIIHNDANGTLKNTITGQTAGLIGYIGSQGNVTGMNIAKDTTSYGFAMDNLNLNTKYWGVVGLNKGSITNSSFKDISITNINSTNAITELSSPAYLTYGAFGENGGKIADIGLNNVLVSGINLPAATTKTAVNIGILGLNNDGDFYNTGSTKSIDTVTINQISANGSQITGYAFIGKNTATSSIGSVYDLVITKFTTGGYGIAYANICRSGTVTTANVFNINISVANTGTSLLPISATMIYKNSGTFGYNTLNASAIPAGAVVCIQNVSPGYLPSNVLKATGA